jgi:alkylation response protein AidB-like acyl-CoA dehydrogenase
LFDSRGEMPVARIARACRHRGRRVARLRALELRPGCEHATWAGLIVTVVEQGRPAGVAVVRVPIGVVDIEHTWDAAGLRGTGSHTILAREVLVPTSHIVRLGPDGVDLAERPMITLANTATGSLTRSTLSRRATARRPSDGRG